LGFRKLLKNQPQHNSVYSSFYSCLSKDYFFVDFSPHSYRFWLTSRTKVVNLFLILIINVTNDHCAYNAQFPCMEAKMVKSETSALFTTSRRRQLTYHLAAAAAAIV